MEAVDSKEEKIIKINMFGGFSIKYGDIPFTFGRAYRSRYIQLFQILLLNQANGIAKDVLLENLYGMREGANQNNSLNNLIFRLRKHLLALGCSQSDDIVIKNGRCWLISKEKICLDVLEFKKLLGMAEPAMGEEKEKLLVQALALYQGELLPQISTEMWVMAESLELKQYFERAVNTLGKLWGNQKKYRQLLPVYTKAAQIYPFENWQEKEIECLVKLNLNQEAHQLYQNTVKLYVEEMGVPPSGEYLRRFQDMGRQLSRHSENLAAIQEELQEPLQDSGAYYCNYPSFIDSYRLMVRLMERSGQSIFLMHCTLVDSKGEPLDGQKVLSRKMEWLCEAIRRTMRRGDLFTKYSSCQYLALLLGTSREDCTAISGRIDRKYQQLSGGMRKEIRYYVTSLAEFPERPAKPGFQAELSVWRK